MKFLCSLVLSSVLASTAFAQLPVEVSHDQQSMLKSDNPVLGANKQLVYDFWRKIIVAHHVDETAKYMAADYVQHNPNVPTGRQAFIDYFSQTPPSAVPATIPNLVSIIAERDMVILALRDEAKLPNDPDKTYTTTWFDMFRIKDGKIVEHWDPARK